MLDQCIWPESLRLQAVNRLVQGLDRPASATVAPVNNEQISIVHYAEAIGIEALPIKTNYSDLPQTLAGFCPGIIQVHHQDQAGYLLVAQCNGRQLKLLMPDGNSHWCDQTALVEFIYQDRGYAADPTNVQVLDELGLRGNRLQKARALLLHQQFAQQPIEAMWFLRAPCAADLKTAIGRERLGKFTAGFMLAHIAGRVALLGGVSLLGYAIAQSLWTPSIVLSWLLAMLSYWAFNALGQMCQVHLDVRLGLIIKRQLQASALRLSPEAQATKGPAKLLGQAMEADGLQHNALPGAFAALNAMIDIAIGLTIAIVIQQWALVLFIIIFLMANSVLTVKFARAYRDWTKQRKQLSQLTIEHIQGNRTRLMQSSPQQRHRIEEHLLQTYWSTSLQFDQWALRLQTLVPGLWLICASAVLCIAIFLSLLSMVQLVALLGAKLLVWQAWHVFADSAQQLVRSWSAWQEVQDLLQPDKNTAVQAHALSDIPASNSSSTLNVNQISFGYRNAQLTLHNLSLHLQQGQQYLLQGESGSGKSTLLALLAGQASPQQGWLLCNDRDLPSMGHRHWRKTICWVPQYHDNYMFSATLLFNLLLGRSWPPTQQDVDDAELACEKLGLTPLLKKMPAGILQSVGEMGWQLSQGERSRVFLARALLQNPDFLLLDESLGALDSATSLQILGNLKNEPSATLLCMHP